MCDLPGCTHRPAQPATVPAAPPEGLSRRRLLETGAAGVVGALAAASLPRAAQAQQSAPRGGRILLKGGTIVSVDPAVGDHAKGDVLIDGEKIAAVGPNLDASGAETIDAGNMIVMPGFIDTHRHMWEGQLRNIIPDAMLPEYLRTMLGGYGSMYRPDDAYIGDLVSAWSALDAGVTTLLDWSHIQNTPEHTDAVIRALKESGVRAVFGYGFPELHGKPWWVVKEGHAFPGDIKRLRTQYFSSSDQLLTLALAATGGFGHGEIAAREWAAAREVGARITIHAGGKGQVEGWAKAFKLGPDTTYVHCSGWGETDWKLVADSGGTVSFSPGTELIMNLTFSPFQHALDAGLRPSLSVDAETNAPTDMFTEMRLALAAQHVGIMVRGERGEKDLPKRLLVRDALELATIAGAKANGLDSRTGSLTPGKQADIILLRKDMINVGPVNDAVGAIVLGMQPQNVDTVFVAGKVKKQHGKLVGVDVPSLMAKAETSRDWLVGRMHDAMKAKKG